MRRRRRMRRSMGNELYTQIAAISYRKLLEATFDLAVVALRFMYCRKCPNWRTCKRLCPEAERRLKIFHRKVVGEKIALN